MSTFFQKRFGNNSQKCNTPQARRLRMEPLESREMLAVNPALFNEVRAAYPGLGLEAGLTHQLAEVALF